MRFSTHSLLPLLLSICQRISTAYTQHTIVQWWLSNKTAHLLYCSLQKMDSLSFVTTFSSSLSSLSPSLTLLRQVNRKKRKKSLLNSRRDRKGDGLGLVTSFSGSFDSRGSFHWSHDALPWTPQSRFCQVPFSSVMGLNHQGCLSPRRALTNMRQ